jgi:nitroreductase
MKTGAVVEKKAVTDVPIHDLLARRWSPRAFSEQPIEGEKIRSLFEAARWAPSSFNEQPWSFVVANREQPEEFGRLLDCLVETNRLWAHRAPVLMLSVARLAFERNGKPNRHAFHDVGLAMENLVLQATALGLFVHQMAGFHIEKARETFGIPTGHEPVAMAAVGYLDDPSILPEPLRQREAAARNRRRAQEFVFTGAWGRGLSLIKDHQEGKTNDNDSKG